MTATEPRPQECQCLTYNVQTLLGAFAAISVLYALIYRFSQTSIYNEFNVYNDDTSNPCAALQRFWHRNAGFLNPLLKIAGQQAPSEECLLTVFAALKPQMLPELIRICLRDACPIPENFTQDMAAKRPSIAGSYRGGIQVSANSIRKEEYKMLQKLLQNLKVRGKVMLCPGMDITADELQEIVKAHCDYICTLPAQGLSDLLPAVRAQGIRQHALTFLNLTVKHPFDLHADQNLSGLVSCHDAGNTAQAEETLLQWDFLHFADDFITTKSDFDPQEAMERGLTEYEIFKCQRFIYESLDDWQETGCVQSVMCLSGQLPATGKHKDTAFLSSLPCLHQEEYLRSLLPVLRGRVSSDNRRKLTLIRQAPACVTQQQSRWELFENMQQADLVADTVVSEVKAMLQKLRKPSSVPPKVRRILTENKEQAVQTAMHYLQAWCFRDDRFLRQDKLLQKHKFVPAQ